MSNSSKLVVLMHDEEVLGTYHTVQRAKKSAKSIGLKQFMMIVEYDLILVNVNHLSARTRTVHTWDERWDCYDI